MTHVRTSSLDLDDPLPGSELGEVGDAITREEWAGPGGPAPASA